MTTCPICREDICSSNTKLACTHSFHGLCLQKWFFASGSLRCPMCRKEIGNIFYNEDSLETRFINYIVCSEMSKLTAAFSTWKVSEGFVRNILKFIGDREILALIFNQHLHGFSESFVQFLHERVYDTIGIDI